MDTDFQHPPQDIPRLIAQINNGYDYVLASRYVKGGAIPDNWTLDRKAVSFFGNLIARVGLLIPQIHDCTGGFKLSRVKGFMDQFDFSTLYSKKFAYKIHLLAYMVVTKHAKVKEVPFHFASRIAGNSKYMTNEIKESLKVIFLFQIHNPTIEKLFKFGVVGGFGFIVNILGAKIFKSLLITPSSNISILNGISNAMAAELSIISNFTWNNLWTFQSDKITKFTKLVSKFVTFNLSSVITGIFIPSVVIAFLTSLFGDHLFIYQVMAIFALTIPLNWFVYNKFIWRKK
jgi:dolichol-phosphate mannosyltransferase